MIRRAFSWAALTATLLTPGPASAERLITSISRHQVLVTSSFTGTSIVLFGTVEPDTPTGRLREAYDIVITVTGPLSERRRRWRRNSLRFLDEIVSAMYPPRSADGASWARRCAPKVALLPPCAASASFKSVANFPAVGT